MTVGVTLAVGALLAGCTPPGADDAVSTAREFSTAVTQDAARACALLVPATREGLEKDGEACATAVARQRDALARPTTVTVGPVDVAGRSARIALGDEVLFLSRFDDGWRVLAAGCRRTSDDAARPYDCDVED